MPWRVSPDSVGWRSPVIAASVSDVGPVVLIYKQAQLLLRLFSFVRKEAEVRWTEQHQRLS